MKVVPSIDRNCRAKLRKLPTTLESSQVDEEQNQQNILLRNRVYLRPRTLSTPHSHPLCLLNGSGEELGLRTTFDDGC